MLETEREGVRTPSAHEDKGAGARASVGRDGPRGARMGARGHLISPHMRAVQEPQGPGSGGGGACVTSETEAEGAV